MKAVVQRVNQASVVVAGQVVGEIAHGLLVLIGVTHDDRSADAAWLAAKLWGLRIFDDEHGQMNWSCADVGGALLVVSQFTLYGDSRKGRRPSFVDAAPGEVAEPLVEAVVQDLRALGAPVATGVFGADMAVSLVNDGPVTVIIESPRPSR